MLSRFLLFYLFFNCIYLTTFAKNNDLKNHCIEIKSNKKDNISISQILHLGNEIDNPIDIVIIDDNDENDEDDKEKYEKSSNNSLKSFATISPIIILKSYSLLKFIVYTKNNKFSTLQLFLLNRKLLI